MKKIVFNDQQISKIVELYLAGISRKQISKQLNLSEHAIRKLIEKANLPERQYKYIGKKFGKLTIMERVGVYANGTPTVKCKCDCGNFTICGISNLINATTQSCGCYNKEITASKNPWLTEYNSYIGNTVKKRKYIFELDVEKFKTLCIATCFYCGVEPSTPMDVGKGMKNGIDRIDSNKGYTLKNCVTCCWTCNRMKSNMTHLDFIEHIRKILNHNQDLI
jgi:hypothetical protein